MDDLLVFGSTTEEHDCNLKTTLEKFMEGGENFGAENT